MSEAPERIGLIGDGMGNWALATVDEADVAIHYIRADVAHAMVAVALREAATKVTGIMEPLALKAYDVGYNSACTDAEDAILALITPDASTALDNVRAEARREGMERAADVLASRGLSTSDDWDKYRAIRAEMNGGDDE